LASSAPGTVSLRRWTPLLWSGPALLLGVLLWHTWNDPDIWYHLALGRGVLLHATASPPEQVILQQEGFRNFYWIFQLAAFTAHAAAGTVGVRLLFLVVWFGIFAIWVKTIGGWRSFPALILVSPAILLCFPRLMERPESFSYLILCLQLLWLSRLGRVERIPRGTIAVWVISQVLWTNMHGYFFLGPLVVCLWLGCDLLRRPFGLTPLRRDAVLLLVLLLLATAVSPFGIGTWKAVGALGTYLRAMRGVIAEFRPPDFSPPWDFSKALLAGWCVTIVALVAGTLIRLRRLSEPALAVVGLALAWYSRRNAPLAVFLSAPLLRLTLDGVAGRFSAGRASKLIPAGIAAVVALSCFGFAVQIATTGSYRPLSGNRRFGSALSPALYPLSAAAYFKDSGFAGRVFNHPSDGGYLAFQVPALTVYGDSRFVDVPKTREYFRALANPAPFLQLDRREGFDGALINIGEDQSSLLWLLVGPPWEIVSGDLCHAVLVKRSTPVGAAAPYGRIRLYGGEDLTLPLNAYCAGEWVRSLAAVGRADLFLAALNQLAEAPNLPPQVARIAWDVGRANDNREILAIAARLSSGGGK